MLPRINGSSAASDAGSILLAPTVLAPTISLNVKDGDSPLSARSSPGAFPPFQDEDDDVDEEYLDFDDLDSLDDDAGDGDGDSDDNEQSQGGAFSFDPEGVNSDGAGEGKPGMDPKAYLAHLAEERRRRMEDEGFLERKRASPNASEMKSRAPYSLASGTNPVAVPKPRAPEDLEPLPLLHFKNEVADVVTAVSITGDVVKSVPNYIPHGMDNNRADTGMLAYVEPDAATSGVSSPPKPIPFEPNRVEQTDPLHCPQHSKRLMKYFSSRAFKELNNRSQPVDPLIEIKEKVGGDGVAVEEEPLRLVDYAMYDIRGKKNNTHKRKRKVVVEEDDDDAEASPMPETFCTCNPVLGTGAAAAPAQNVDSTPSNTCCAVCVNGRSLAFDANFESGNLQKAVRTDGRNKLMPINCASSSKAPRRGGKQSAAQEENADPAEMSFNNTTGFPCIEVDQEYTLWCRKDLNTNGNIQWYYFSVNTPPDTASAKATGRTEPYERVTYPLTVRFQIVNMMKKDALYNFGMRPATMSTLDSLASVNGASGDSTSAAAAAAAAAGSPDVGPVGSDSPPPPAAGSPGRDRGRDSASLEGRVPADNTRPRANSSCSYASAGSGASGGSALSGNGSGGVRSPKGVWRHLGEDVCYFKNYLSIETVDTLGVPVPQSLAEELGQSGAASSNPTKKKKKAKQFYTLTWTYTFTKPGDTVYFAHCYPYTYTDLQVYLHKLEKAERYQGILQRRLLCATLAGNRCDLLTITARPPVGKKTNSGGDGDGGEDSTANDGPGSKGGIAAALASANKPVIVLTARVHPGESNSSYAMHGLLEFILSDHPDAVALRNTFVFKIVPMMNPDGVIHGNYRCSLAATDLNRRYSNCSSFLHPSVYAIRSLLGRMQESRGVFLYLDIHGHSKNKNVFLYGCDIVQQPENWLRSDLEGRAGGPRLTRTDVITQRVFTRTYPLLLCTLSSSRAATKAASASAKGVPVQPVEPTGLGALETPGYFSYADTKFSVTKSKRGTGRIVAWKDIGVESAYTVELSFCGLGENREAKLFSKAEDRGFDIIYSKEKEIALAQQRKANSNSKPRRSGGAGAAGDDRKASTFTEQSQAASTAAAFSAYDKILASQNNSSFGGGVNTSTLANLENPSVLADYIAYKELVENYRTTVHFTKGDMLNVGRDLMLALSEMANLPQAYDYRVPPKTSWQHAYGDRALIPTASSANSAAQEEKEEKLRAAAVTAAKKELAVSLELSKRIIDRPFPSVPEPSIPFYTMAESIAPLIHAPYCFSSDAAYQLQRKFPIEFEAMGMGYVSKYKKPNDSADGNTGSTANSDKKDGVNVGMRVKVELDLTRSMNYIFENPQGLRDNEARSTIRFSNATSSAASDGGGGCGSGEGGADRSQSVSPAPSGEGLDSSSALTGAPSESDDNNKGNRGKKRALKKGGRVGGTSSKASSAVDLSEFLSEASRNGAGTDVESAGSDSDPSVDNVPTETMLRRIGKAKVEAGSGPATDISNILRTAEIKKRRADTKAAKQESILEKKRLAALQKQQFRQYQEESRLFDEAQAKRTFANSIPGPPTMRTNGGGGTLGYSAAQAASQAAAGGGGGNDNDYAGVGDPLNPKFNSGSRKSRVPNATSKREKAVLKSRNIPRQKRVFLSHAPAYKLSSDYDDDAASVTAVSGIVSSAQSPTRYGNGSYFREGQSLNATDRAARPTGAASGAGRQLQSQLFPISQDALFHSNSSSPTGFSRTNSISADTGSQSPVSRRPTSSPSDGPAIPGMDSPTDILDTGDTSFGSFVARANQARANGVGRNLDDIINNPFAIQRGNHETERDGRGTRTDTSASTRDLRSQSVSLSPRGLRRSPDGEFFSDTSEGDKVSLKQAANAASTTRRAQQLIAQSIRQKGTGSPLQHAGANMVGASRGLSGASNGEFNHDEANWDIGGVHSGASVLLTGSESTGQFTDAPSTSMTGNSGRAEGAMIEAIRERANVRERERERLLQTRLVQERLNSISTILSSGDPAAPAPADSSPLAQDVRRSRGLIRGVVARNSIASPADLRSLRPSAGAPLPFNGDKDATSTLARLSSIDQSQGNSHQHHREGESLERELQRMQLADRPAARDEPRRRRAPSSRADSNTNTD